MKRPLLLIGVTTWVLVGTMFLSRWWYANPDYFPPLPEPLWEWFDWLFGARNVDEASNVEFIVVILLALIVVLITTTLAAAYQYAKKNSR